MTCASEPWEAAARIKRRRGTQMEKLAVNQNLPLLRGRRCSLGGGESVQKESLPTRTRPSLKRGGQVLLGGLLNLFEGRM